MSKVLCTLAFYHDGGTLKPQLVVSCNPTTQITMKGTDWKGARITNTNCNPKFGARNRFEYSFTGGKSVTRCSLVMNTSAVLPPFMWLSKHPTGPPTRRGPRGPAGLRETEEAKREAARERAKIMAKKELKKIEAKRSPSPRDLKRQEELEDQIHNERQKSKSPKVPERERARRIDSRGYASPPRHSYDLAANQDGPYPHIPDRETRLQERRKRLRSVSASSTQSHTVYRRSKRRGYREYDDPGAGAGGDPPDPDDGDDGGGDGGGDGGADGGGGDGGAGGE